MHKVTLASDSLAVGHGSTLRAPTAGLATLRFEGRAQLDAPPGTVFEMVSDPTLLHRWLPFLRKVQMDHSKSEMPAQCAAGSRRHCSFRGMGDVEEGIFWWNPPHGYGFHFAPQGRGRLMTPTTNHSNFFLVAPDGDGGSLFTIRVHFEWRGLLMRHLAVRMMPMMLNMGFDNLRREFGGRGGKMRRVG